MHTYTHTHNLSLTRTARKPILCPLKHPTPPPLPQRTTVLPRLCGAAAAGRGWACCEDISGITRGDGKERAAGGGHPKGAPHSLRAGLAPPPSPRRIRLKGLCLPPWTPVAALRNRLHFPSPWFRVVLVARCPSRPLRSSTLETNSVVATDALPLLFVTWCAVYDDVWVAEVECG